MSESFSERLAKKAAQAKQSVRGESNALVPVSGDTSMATAVNRKAAEIAKSISLDASALRGLNAIQNKIDRTQLDSPLGAIAFFKRLGAQARTKYNEAQSTEIATFTSLQTTQHTALKTQIKSAYELSQLPHDLAMETFLKEALQQGLVTKAAGDEQILRQAFSEGWADVLTYQEVKKGKALEDIRLSGRQVEIDQDLTRTRELQQIEYEFGKKKLDDEVDGTIRLANTGNLTRAQSLAMIEDYDRKLRDPNLSDRMKQNYLREITKLEGELFSESSGMAAKADAGQDPEGGTTPPVSGNDPSTPPRAGKQQPAGTDTRHVN